MVGRLFGGWQVIGTHFSKLLQLQGAQAREVKARTEIMVGS